MLVTEGPSKTDEPRPSSCVMIRGEGRVTVGRRGPSLVVCRLSGVLEPAHAQWMITELDRHLYDGVRVVFIDVARLAVFPPSLGRALTQWLHEHRSQLESVHALGGTPDNEGELEALRQQYGGPLTCHSDTRGFEAELESRAG